MKKVIIGLLVSFVFCSQNICAVKQQEEPIDLDLTDEVRHLSDKVDQIALLLQDLNPEMLKKNPSSPSSVTGKANLLFKQTQNIFQYIVDKADKLLSKKTIIATMLAIGPLFYVYSSFIDPYLLEKLLTFIAKAAVFGGIRTTAPVAKGIFAGFWEGFWYYKWQVLAASTFFVSIMIGGVATVTAGSVIGKSVADKVAEGLTPYLAGRILAGITSLFPFVKVAAESLIAG